jgi:hypothetical protein
MEQHVRETGIVTRECRTPTDCTGTSQRKCHNCNCRMRPLRSPFDMALFQPRVLETLRDKQLLPFHYSRGAHMFPVHMQICEWLRHQHAADGLHFHKILWTDEACDGAFSVLWTRDHPHVIGVQYVSATRGPSSSKFFFCYGGDLMLGGSLVTTAWRVLRLRMEETPSRCGG